MFSKSGLYPLAGPRGRCPTATAATRSFAAAPLFSVPNSLEKIGFGAGNSRISKDPGDEGPQAPDSHPLEVAWKGPIGPENRSFARDEVCGKLVLLAVGWVSVVGLDQVEARKQDCREAVHPVSERCRPPVGRMQTAWSGHGGAAAMSGRGQPPSGFRHLR